MKKNLYIIALVLVATAFTSCSHDYNYDEEYDIAGYFSGADPRNNLVYFPTNTMEYSNEFAADIPLGEDSHTFKFTATISRNLTNATKVQVAHAADAPLLATTYKGYQVVPANQVTIPNGGTFEFGTDATQIEIPVTVTTLSKMTKPTVVPFRVTPTNDNLSSPKTVKQDYAYIVITPKEVWTAELDGTGSVVKLDGAMNSYTSGETLPILFATDKVFNEECKVGLERDNSIFKSGEGKKLAPDGIEVALAEKAKGESYIQTTVQLQHPEKFTTAGEYVLPMRAVFYDKSGKKHYITGGEVLIPINVVNVALEPSSDEPSGTEIPSSDFDFSLSNQMLYGSIENLTNGVTDEYGYMPQGITNLTIDLQQPVNVKGIKIGMFVSAEFAYYADKVKVYGSTNGTTWTPLSEDINIKQTTWNNINATKQVNVRYLKLEFSVSDYLGSLTEIKIFK